MLIGTVFVNPVTYVTEDHYYEEWHSSNSEFISSTHGGGHSLTSVLNVLAIEMEEWAVYSVVYSLSSLLEQ